MRKGENVNKNESLNENNYDNDEPELVMGDENNIEMMQNKKIDIPHPVIGVSDGEGALNQQTGDYIN